MTTDLLLETSFNGSICLRCGESVPFGERLVHLTGHQHQWRLPNDGEPDEEGRVCTKCGALANSAPSKWCDTHKSLGVVDTSRGPGGVIDLTADPLYYFPTTSPSAVVWGNKWTAEVMGSDDPPLMEGKPRSSQWPNVRAEKLERTPKCEACDRGDKTSNQVHHVKPYHLFPELELKQSNLLTMCPLCHFVIGHLGDWRLYDPDVRLSAVIHKGKVRNAKMTHSLTPLPLPQENSSDE